MAKINLKQLRESIEKREELREKQRKKHFEKQRIRHKKSKTEALTWAENTEILFNQRTPNNTETARILGFNYLKKRDESSGKNISNLHYNNIELKKLDRYTVNHLRHKYTNYEDVLDEMNNNFSPFATGKALKTIRRRCFSMISERFPDLANECERQSKR